MNPLLPAFAWVAPVCCKAQKETPSAVTAAFAKYFPGITAKRWDKEDGNYEANFKKDGKTMSATFNAKGGWLETETDIAVAELPTAVSAYVKQHYNSAEIKEAAFIKTPKGEMYEAEVKGKDLLFDKSGKFIKEVAETEDKEDEKD